MPGERIRLKFSLNGREVTVHCPPGRRLIDIIRLDFGLTGTREGCGWGECGSCLVLMNGDLVNACLIPAFRLPEAEIVTIEGLDRLQEGENIKRILNRLLNKMKPFPSGHSVSGIQMSLAALLLQNPNPTEGEVRAALAGNRHACSTYPALVQRITQMVNVPGKRRYERR